MVEVTRVETSVPDGALRNGADVLLLVDFVLGDIADLRHRCREHALAAGLDRSSSMAFVLAINEVVNNAVEHGGGGGRLILLHDRAGRMIARIVDAGHAPVPTVPHHAPPPDAERGRGLWMSSQLVDQMAVAPGEPHGTAVTITMIIRPA